MVYTFCLQDQKANLCLDDVFLFCALPWYLAPVGPRQLCLFRLQSKQCVCTLSRGTRLIVLALQLRDRDSIYCC